PLCLRSEPFDGACVMFEHPILLWLLLLAPLAVAPGLLTTLRAGKPLIGALSTACRLITFVALVLMLAGLRIPIRAAAHRMAMVIAVDESRSIAPDQQAWMQRKLTDIRHHASTRDAVAIIGFGRDARLLLPLEDPRV